MLLISKPDGIVANDRREEVLKRREEQKQATLDRRIQYNLGQVPNPG